VVLGEVGDGERIAVSKGAKKILRLMLELFQVRPSR